MITKILLENARPGQIMAAWLAVNHPSDLYMTNNRRGDLLLCVAVKGYADDFAIYCMWNHGFSQIQWVADNGDKLSRQLASRYADSEAMKHYRC